MRIGPKTRKFLESLKEGGQSVARGYGKAVRFTQKYAPKAEAGFGRAAQMSVESFRPTKFETQPEFSFPMRRQMPMRPMRPTKRHDFGSLTFDI
jgi:hypothetical protein